MNTNHTPGPWYVTDEGSQIVIQTHSEHPTGTLARIYRTDELAHTDARLIAAAPELLDVAQKTLIFFESFKPSFPASTPMGAIIEGNIEILRETIAKATQSQP